MTDAELLARLASEGARLDEVLARFTEEASDESPEALAARCDDLLDAIQRLHLAAVEDETAPDPGNDGQP